MAFKTFAYWGVRIAFLPLYPLRVTGLQNIPSGAALVCSNHTSMKDPVLLILAMKCKNFPVSMAKMELFQSRPLSWLLKKLDTFPIHRGKSDVGAIKFALSSLKNGRKLLMFPEGTRVRDGDDGGAKTGAGMLALRSGAQVLPVFVAKYKKLFRPVDIVFGEPFFAECGHKPTSEDYQIISDDIMRKVALLEPKLQLQKSKKSKLERPKP